MSTSGYPVADTAKGAWENNANLFADTPTFAIPRSGAIEKFDPMEWEPDWSNPLNRKLMYCIMPGASSMVTPIARVYVHPSYGEGSAYITDAPVNKLSPESAPSLFQQELYAGAITVSNGSLNSAEFNSTNGYASTIMWVGVPGNAGTNEGPLAALYGMGGSYDTGWGLTISGDAHQARAFVANSGTYEFASFQPLVSGKLNVVISSAPLDTTGTLVKPTAIGVRNGLIHPHSSGTARVNPIVSEFALGPRGQLNGASQDTYCGFYTYAAFVWSEELPTHIQAALVQDPRIILKRTRVRKPAAALLRVYDSTLPLYTQVDDAPTCDTSDFIYTDETSSATLQLSAVDDPASSTGHALTYKARSDSGGDLVVTLQQGGVSSALVVPKIWTRKQPAILSIDTTNPLTRRLDPKVYTWDWGGGVPLVATPYGVARQFSNSGVHYFTNPWLLGSSVFLWFRPESEVAWSALIKDGDLRMRFYCCGSTTTIKSLSFGGGTSLSSANLHSYLPINKWAKMSFSMEDGHVTTYVNGVAVDDTTGTAGQWNGATSFGIGDMEGTINAKVVMAAYWPRRMLTPAEHLSLHTDPWQLFKPRRAAIYSGGAAAIATRTHNNVPTDWTDYTMTLTTEEADSITDYSKLHVKLDGTP